MSRQRRSVSRRHVLASAAAIPLALAIGSSTVLARGAPPARGLTAALPALPRVAIGTGDPRHLAWVWQFRHDGHREVIRDVLAAHGLGIAIKTHDGLDWMSKYDDSDGAIAGPDSVASLARYFEDGGVPFHAWGVLHGTNPLAEAAIAASVLSAGARSISLDLEAHSGFWRGTNDDAERYGAELRRLQPDAFVATSIDARPWEVPRIPMAEFAQFTDAIAPQVYWGAFNNKGNIARYKLFGDDPGTDGITPRFALQSAIRAVSEFGLPVHPIGDGTVGGGQEWSDFIDESFASQAEAISVWRFGVADEAVWQLLQASPPRPPVPTTYAVQSGDTLSVLASKWGTSVDAIVRENGLANANFLFIGQQLRVPGGGTVTATSSGGSVTPTSRVAPTPASPSTRRYTVQPGDSLWSIAIAFKTSVDAIATANKIGNQGFIRIGDILLIP